MTLWLWGLLCGVVLAASPEVRVEQGWIALEGERTAEALSHAREVLQAHPDDPEAIGLLVAALLEGGLAPWVLDAPTVETPAETRLAAIQAAVEAGDDEAAAKALSELLEALPDRPDLLAPVRTLEPAGRKLARARTKALKAVDKALARGQGDALWLYRVRRLRRDLARAGVQGVATDLEPVLAALARHGHTAPDLRPWTRFELQEEGRRQAAAGQVDLPDSAPPGALVVLVERLAADAQRRGQGAVAVSAWEALRARQDSAEAALGHASALSALSRHEEALSVLDEALTLAVDPAPADLSVGQGDRRQDLLARALHQRAVELDALVRLDEARVDLLVADLLAGGAVDAALSRKLRKAALLRQAGAPEALLAKARAAEDPAPQASAALVAMAIAGGGEVWRRELAQAHRLIGASVEGGPARVAYTLALLLDPHADDLRALARLHEAAGHPEAAFRACALLSAASPSEDVDACLVRTWTGPGRPELAVEALTAEVVVETVAPPAEEVPREPRGEPASAVTPVAIGAPVRALALEDETGRITGATLRGRVAVVVFLDVSSVDGLNLLYDFGAVARKLRGTGRDIVVLGVAIDGPEQEARFLHLRNVASKWGALYRDPQLAAAWGVQVVPVAYLIDQEGMVRGEVRRWLGRAHIERELRRVLQE